MTAHIRRRDLLVASAFGAVGALAVAGCGSSSTTGADSTTSASGNGGASTSETSSTGAATSAAGGTGPVALPKHIAFSGGATPDLAPTDGGVPAAYLSYPKSLKSTGMPTPGAGGKTTTFTGGMGPLPTPVDKNTFWQELNKKLGTTLDVSITTSADYAQKMSTMIAGDDLPDIVQLQPGSIPNFADVLKAKFVDLTDELSGDAVSEYPLLANHASASWRGTIFNDAIWGVPYEQPLVPAMMFVRSDITTKLGLDPNPKSLADLRDLFRKATDPKANRWAVAAPTDIWKFLQIVLGAPNGWKLDGAKLVNSYETDETKQALSILADMWKEGVVYPDSFAQPWATKEQWFGGGQICFTYDSYNNILGFLLNNLPSEPEFKVSFMQPPSESGNGFAKVYQGTGIYTVTGIPKSSAKRTKELLRIMNWVSAPFGTTEWQFCQYGIEGHDFAMKDGQPTANDVGTAEVHDMAIPYIGNCPPVLFYAGHSEYAKAQYDCIDTAAKNGLVVDPTNGLYSPTNSEKGAAMSKVITDAMDDIVQGRKKIGDWDTAVAAWRKAGGDQVRSEYEKAYAAGH